MINQLHYAPRYDFNLLKLKKVVNPFFSSIDKKNAKWYPFEGIKLYRGVIFMAKKEKNAPVQEKESSDSDLMRKFKQNPAIFVGTIIVLVLIVVSFVIVPAFVPNSGGLSGDLTFGYYDKIPISWVPGNVFSQYYDQVYRYYQNAVGSENLQYYEASIWQQAFEAAAVHIAILQEMKKSGYTVPTKTVDRYVAQLPQFQINGRFSAALYRQMSTNSRASLWKQIQEELTRELYFSDTTRSLLVSAGEAKFIGKMASPNRKFEMASFKIDDYPEAEYLSFARENPQLFNTIHLSIISVTSEKEAKQILASINDGTTSFEDAARAQSQDNYKDRGGDMGIRNIFEIEREITDSEVREKIYSLGRGELSSVIRHGDNWAFFRIEDDTNPANFEDSAVLEKVRSYMRSFERGRMEDWAIAQAREFISDANSSNFDSALNKINKTKQSFGPLPVNFGNVDLFTSLASFSIPELSNAPTSENFWKVIFSTPVNSFSEPLVQGNNVLVFLPLEETEAEEAGIEGIESSYSSYWANYIAHQSISQFFLNSPKMDNRFYDTYYNTFSPAGF